MILISGLAIFHAGDPEVGQQEGYAFLDRPLDD